MRKVLTLVLFIVLSALGLGNGEVKWTVSQITGSISSGGKATVEVKAEIQPGWHLYSVVPVNEGPFPTTFSSEDLTLDGAILEAPLVKEFDKGFNKDINFFRDKATFQVPVKFGSKALGGKLTVTYQVCKDGVCIPPQPVDLNLKSAKVMSAGAPTSRKIDKKEVVWQLTQIEGSGKPGTDGTVVIEAEIKDGWHLYSVIDQNGPSPTTVTGKGITVGQPKDIVESQLIRQQDPGFLKEINFFKGKAKFWIPVTFGDKGLDAKITLDYQVCNNGTCIPPQPVEFDLKSATLVAESTKPDKSPAPKKVKATATSNVVIDPIKPKGGSLGEGGKIQEAREKGLVAYIWLAIAAGFTALLTPCVFPMIPITVSFFSKQKEGAGIKPALLYCGGIIGTFTLLGFVVSLIAGATGLTQLANNPWVNLGLAIIFIVLALSLFGVFEIGLPSKFVNKFDSTGKSALLAPILMGLTFSLTSFTCTLPFVGAVLVGASQGDWIYPIIGMMAFSSAFSLPFFLLALFPQALSKLPKSGAWMVTVKAYMGFIELIAAVKFLSTFDLSFELGLITREMNLALWFMLMVLAAIYLLGWIRMPKVHDGKIGALRIVFGVVTMIGALLIGKAFNGGSLGNLEGFLPPSPYPGHAAAAGKGSAGNAWAKDFVEDYDAVLAKAKENGKPIFIDFTGIYCTNCRVMERNVFPTAQVQKEFEKFNKVSLYTDRKTNPKYAAADTKNSELQQKLVRVVTLPTYVVVKPDGTTVVDSTPFMNDPDRFAKWLSDNAAK